MLKLAILNDDGVNKVAIVPNHIDDLKLLGLEILVEKNAGETAFFADNDYEEKGANVVGSREKIVKNADIIVSVLNPGKKTLNNAKKNSLFIGQFKPFEDKEIEGFVHEKELQVLSLDMLPRTTIAQSMDVLSSMASIAGYRAVVEAAKFLPRYFPMMITAAGSVKPAKVVVLGAGVAGLQAIATAKRLGAAVEAYDVRSAAKEEVLSLGAKFIEIEGAVEDTGAGGYAVEQSEEFIKRQQEEVQKRARAADVIITTAQVRGRKAPILLPNETVESMKAGSVVVDLASSSGGNCALSKDQKVIDHNGITIIGNSDLSDGMPQDASFLFSKNILNLLKILIKEEQLVLDLENEIIAKSLI